MRTELATNNHDDDGGGGGGGGGAGLVVNFERALASEFSADYSVDSRANED